MHCPHCDRPLDRVGVLRRIDDEETWERDPDTDTWRRTEHTVDCVELTRYCATCFEELDSLPMPPEAAR